MLSLRLLTSCSARSMSALTSSQLVGAHQQTSNAYAIASTAQCNQYDGTTISRGYCQPSSTTLVARRQLTTSSIDSAARLDKIKTALAAHESEMNLPSKPKKPVTPWIMFVRERKDQVLAQQGRDKMSAAEISVILAKEWQHTDKSRYQREYDQMHDEYERQVRRYEESLTDEHRDFIDLQREAKRDSKAIKQLKKTNPPKLPRNAPNFYCQERSQQDDFKELLKTNTVGQAFSIVFKEYRDLSDSEKRKYQEMVEEDKARFQHEFLAWFEGVQSNENLSKAARDHANAMRERLKGLSYI